MEVKEIMTPNPITVTSDTTVGKIREIFSRMRIWSIYVTNNGKLEGIFTKSDLRNRMYGKSLNTPVSAVMSRDVKWVKSDTDVEAAAEYLSRFHINGLAIVKDGTLCGILTRYDIKTRYYRQSHSQAIEGEGIKIGVPIDNGMADGKKGEELPESPGIDITGKKEMIQIRNIYQKKLDSDYSEIVRVINSLNHEFDIAVNKKNDAQELKENIQKHMEERDRAFTNLQNLLNKEEKYETGMLDKTLRGMKAKGRAIIKQKLKDVDIDTLQYGSVEQYKRLYPHYGAEIFKNITEVNVKEQEIRKAQEVYNHAVSSYNSQTEITEKNMGYADGAFAKYEKDYKNGDDEIKDCRYYGSTLYKLERKKTKLLLNLNTLNHDISGLKNTMVVIKRKFSAIANAPLEEMKY
jgi:hypothetical protein